MAPRAGGGDIAAPGEHLLLTGFVYSPYVLQPSCQLNFY